MCWCPRPRFQIQRVSSNLQLAMIRFGGFGFACDALVHGLPHHLKQPLFAGAAERFKIVGSQMLRIDEMGVENMVHLVVGKEFPHFEPLARCRRFFHHLTYPHPRPPRRRLGDQPLDRRDYSPTRKPASVSSPIGTLHPSRPGLGPQAASQSTFPAIYPSRMSAQGMPAGDIGEATDLARDSATPAYSVVLGDDSPGNIKAAGGRTSAAVSGRSPMAETTRATPAAMTSVRENDAVSCFGTCAPAASASRRPPGLRSPIEVDCFARTTRD